MSKWDTGRIVKPAKDNNASGAYWAGGKLWIDGMDARTLVAACIDRGLLVRGVEVFRRDGKPVFSVKKEPKR